MPSVQRPGLGHRERGEEDRGGGKCYTEGWSLVSVYKVGFGAKKEIDFPPKPGISLISYLERQGGAHSA